MHGRKDKWDVQTPGVCQSSTVGFENAIRVPTLMHVITNASNDMLDRCATLNTAVDKLTDVTKMLSSKHSLDRLKSRCFSSSTGKVFHKDLESVKSQVYRKRWASVAQSVLSVNKFRSILVWGWNSDAYVDGSESSLSDKGLVAGVDEAITKVSWWEAMRVLVVLAHCMSMSVRWCVSCPCHGHLLDQWERGEASENREMIGLWRRWPMRGKRLPEVAAGDFLEYAKETLDLAAARLYVELDRKRAVLIGEFELARGHVLFTLAMKLQPLTIPPGLVLASAHHNLVKARQALGRVLPSTCRHPQILALQAKPLVDQAKAFLAGTSLKDLPEFEEYVAAKKFRMEFRIQM